MDEKLLAPCGTYCRLCPHFKKERIPHCSGCGTIKGKPFWGKCGLYACTRNHEVEHCGLCNVFPCDLFITQYDPENGQKSAFVRAGILSYRKKVGIAKYIKMIKKLEEQKIQKSNH